MSGEWIKSRAPLKKGQRIRFDGRTWRVVRAGVNAHVTPTTKETVEINGKTFRRKGRDLIISRHAEVERWTR